MVNILTQLMLLKCGVWQTSFRIIAKAGNKVYTFVTLNAPYIWVCLLYIIKFKNGQFIDDVPQNPVRPVMRENMVCFCEISPTKPPCPFLCMLFIAVLMKQRRLNKQAEKQVRSLKSTCKRASYSPRSFWLYALISVHRAGLANKATVVCQCKWKSLRCNAS